MDDLFDIVTPDPVSLWPPGPAWFLVAVVILIGVAFLVWLRWRKWRRNAYRRTAIEQLEGIRTVHEVNQLLKRVALVSFDRSNVASLSGSDWIAFLRNTGGRFNDNHGVLLAEGYRKITRPTLSGFDSLVAATKAWIRNHHV